MKGLKAEIENTESARFIEKAQINESHPWAQKIPIPTNARYLRTKGKDVKYFENKIQTKKNGFIEIPEDAMYVSFPSYSIRSGHTSHGEPTFHYN